MAAVLLLGGGPASANVALTQVSTDPYTNTTSQHRTEVEPDTFSSGSTMVSAFQVGRFFDGGASGAGFATSTNGGSTWTRGFLPGITKFQGNGPYDRTSDESVAYDAKHTTWMISSLAITESGGVTGAAVVTSRSTDGGLTWTNPVTTATGGSLDKNWIACDNSAGGGQPVVRPNGTVLANCTASTSITGGRAWPTIEVANAPSGGTFDEATYEPTGGLPITGGPVRAVTGPVYSTGARPSAAVTPPTAR
ncbi:MAG: hypothetical protein ACJ72W_19705 [Actinoallomurus sp.]